METETDEDLKVGCLWILGERGISQGKGIQAMVACQGLGRIVQTLQQTISFSFLIFLTNYIHESSLTHTEIQRLEKYTLLSHFHCIVEFSDLTVDRKTHARP